MNACTEPRPPIPLGVGYSADGAYADPALFAAEIRQGGRRVVVVPQQLTISRQTPTHVDAGAKVMRLYPWEEVTVRVAVVAAPGDTVAASSVSWTPEPKWRYGVTAVVGAERPVGFCILSVSDAGELPPRAGTRGDTLFIVRSGIQEGTVC